ncbi:signal peptide peptidase-domain-containing protein [Xylaria sp. CBS 124048]|nr:signal peptide peptidase-domain-containing protein [Xylaria sp. CBS 124048]
MATENSTVPLLDEVSLSNVTTELATNRTIYEKLAGVPILLANDMALLSLEFRILFVSIACIYIASHAALCRPPSAKSLKKDKHKNKKKRVEDAEDEDHGGPIEGLVPSDAIRFPVLAGTMLIGLYYLIRWLEDPAILNKIMRVYFSSISIASMNKLFADTLQLVIGFIFPSVWVDTQGTLYHVDSKKKGHWYTRSGTEDRVWDDKKKTPMPGFLSEIKLPDGVNTLLWSIHRLFVQQWNVRLVLHGIVDGMIKIKFSGICGVVFSIVANVLYYTHASTFMSNVMGYAFAYTGIIMLSPTTFATGSSVLFGLFFYDIVMVFYTPYMVTVATKLDVPIKLVFEGPQRSSMLGLGDIVVPGMFIALCLRFDHYMYYYRQRKLKEVELQTDDASTGEVITTKRNRRMVVKPEYVSPKGQWGNRFWTTKLMKTFSPDATPAVRASAFPRPYFYAAIVGYLFAMVVTVLVLLAFQHAQPALLYLVPGVVSAVWITGAVRGEIRQMWEYTEDGSLDKIDVIVEVDAEGHVIKEIEDDKDGEKDKQSDAQREKNNMKKSADRKTTEENKTEKSADTSDGEPPTIKNENEVEQTKYAFLLSVEMPGDD